MKDPVNTQIYRFPQGFVFGAATAAQQIEGAADVDGRSDSVWDVFCRQPGAIADGKDARQACRHYEKWQADLDLLKDLGVSSYRFSVAWPRILPGGTGQVNARGLDFYERLVDGMLERGIQPNATLYHWDLPALLEDKGGWLNPDSPKWFEEYSAAVLKRLGDRVDYWATFNEPQIFIHHGYEYGVHAPGKKEKGQAIYQRIHHVLLAHGRSARVIRQLVKPGAKLGIAMAPSAIWPGTDKPQDVEASERHWRRTNDWWTLPIVKGGYPEDVLALLGAQGPVVKPGDMDLIQTPLDFIGINYYTPGRVVHDASLGPLEAKQLPIPAGAPLPDFPGWEIFAPGLENVITQFWHRYRVPLYVTENGTSSVNEDAGPGADGKIHDPKRIGFIRDHLIHCLRSIEDGVDLRGYYVWSLMDNFEWGFGYTQRFGLTHVDYQTFKRTPKDSFAWYRELCKTGAFEGPELPRVKSAFDRGLTAGV